jgi:hypothetical protein
MGYAAAKTEMAGLPTSEVRHPLLTSPSRRGAKGSFGWQMKLEINSKLST